MEKKFGIKVGFTLAEGATHVNTPPTKAKFGFTLAEVLITLGIIGVVAALTIPRLINNYKAARLKSQFLKSYSTIQQVFKHMQDDEISLDPNSYVDGNSFYKEFLKYLQGASICNGRNPQCPHGGVKYAGINNAWLDDGKILLSDGTLLMFENMARSTLVLVTVDLNGYKNPPNIVGYDTFSFQLINGEILAVGDNGTFRTGERYCDIDLAVEVAQRAASGGSDYGTTCAHYAKVDADYFKKVVRKYKYNFIPLGR